VAQQVKVPTDQWAAYDWQGDRITNNPRVPCGSAASGDVLARGFLSQLPRSSGSTQLQDF
jgi:hypothetical protein